jgi:hypothetical protein
MAYEMLSGRRPFEPDNDSATSLILKVMQQPAEPMNTDMSRMLPEIESIVQRAMAKTPAERFQTADEMRAALMHFLEQSKARITSIESSEDSAETKIVSGSTATIAPKSIPVAPLTTSHSRSRTWWWAGGAAAAVVVAAIVMAAPSRSAVVIATNTSANVTPDLDVSARPPAAEPQQPQAPAATPSTPTARDLVLTPKPAPAAPAAPKELDAREMFAANDANVSPGLRFRLIQAGAGDAPMDVDPAKQFTTGDRIRFAFESNIDGYLYVAQQGTSGNWNILYPHPDINGGRNSVKKLSEIVIPDDNYFRLDPPSGDEHVFVFLSREQMATLPGFSQPVTKPFQSGSAPMIASLQSSIQSRDLVLAKEPSTSKTQATYVVNKAELGKAVTASFTITHK